MKNIIISIFLFSCQSVKSPSQHTSMKDDVNESIIDGFYKNDTTGVGSKIFLIK